MTDPTPRDDVVARALRALPVPDHGPSFWADLDRLLAQEAPAPSRDDTEAEPPVHRLDTGELPAVTDLGHERPSGRSRRAPMLAAAAAVAVLALAVALVTLAGDSGDPDEDDLAGGGTDTTLAATTTAAPSDAVAPTSESTPETAPSPVEAAETPDAAVRAWLEALGEGETETAAALLGQRTLRYIESLGADVVGFMEESQEAYGPWAGSPDLEISSSAVGPVDLLGPGAQLAIVTLVGTFPGEGDRGFTIDVVPVVDDGDGWRVEHLAYSPDRDNRPVFTVPSQSESGLGGMNPDGEINVFVPAHGTVFFQIDRGELGTDTTSLVGTQAEPFALYNPPGELAVGTHQLVVGAVGDDSTITYFAGTFTVEG